MASATHEVESPHPNDPMSPWPSTCRGSQVPEDISFSLLKVRTVSFWRITLPFSENLVLQTARQGLHSIFLFVLSMERIAVFLNSIHSVFSFNLSLSLQAFLNCRDSFTGFLLGHERISTEQRVLDALYKKIVVYID